jgi:hypothetical protein
LSEKFPSADQQHLAALAEVWSEELDLIVRRMLSICRAEVGPVIPIEVRHEAIFELANLQLWLEDRLIEKKTASILIGEIDPDRERAALSTKDIQERIENTARICAESIWKPTLNEWGRRFPLILTASRQAKGRRLTQITGSPSPGVRKQHYSPVFSNRYWASGSNNRVRIYSRGLDLQIQHSDEGYKKWAWEPFIYSQSLERYFSLVEGDAKIPYSKLLEMIPLSEGDRRHWIAFLVVQLFRTPSFLLKNLATMPTVIESRGINYPTDTASLRRAYETLFTNNDVFAWFYRLLVGRPWEMWSAPTESQFVRADDPVVINGSVIRGTWQLVYPMSPSRCFVAGPAHVEDQPAVVPTNRKLTEAEVSSVNERLAMGARRTVIAKITTDDSGLRVLLESAIGKGEIDSGWLRQMFPEYWGDVG